MKRTLKKLLRLVLVFLSCFALVCFCLPTKAFAQEFTFNGNSSTSMDLKANAYNFFISKLKELYDSLGTSEDWANFCEEHGVDILTQTINYNNNFVLDIMAEELSAVTGIPEPFLHLSTELSNIDDIYQNTTNYSARGKKNYDDFSQFYKYANMRGSTDDIKGAEVTATNWANSQELYIYQIRPDVLSWDNDHSQSWWLNMAGISYQPYLGTYSHTYDVPETIWGYNGSYYYNNGDFTLSSQDIDDSTGFNIDPDTCRYFVRLGGLYNGSKIAIFSQTFGGQGIVPVENCHLEGDYIIVPNDVNNSEVSFYIHQDSCEYSNFHIYTENFSLGGMTAPSTPTFQYPEKENNPYYEREVQEYNYYTALTQQILDDYDVSQLYNDLYKSFEGSSWLTFPLEVWRDLGDLMLDGYSSTFHFHIDRIDLDFIDFGFNFPECDFEFDPYDYIGGASDLQNAMGVLFVTFQHIIAFGYIYALIVWGRSLILRIGSDTLHRDYEDN